MHVDVHAHLFLDEFAGDVDAVVKRARDSHVRRIVNNGLDAATNQTAIDLAGDHFECEAACGVHPERLPTMDDSELRQVYEQMRRDAVVAVGEVGLDYGYADSDEQRRHQRDVFRHCIRVAREERKPIIIHSRGAEDDVLDILEDENARRVILHAFTGRRHQWRRGLRNGYYFSIPPVVSRSTQFQELVDDAKIYQLLTETDSPYLAPEKGRRNEPSNVTIATQYINDQLDTLPAEGNIQDNYQRLFLNIHNQVKQHEP